jgi:peptidoglycan/LPS O-acetylase OafA/YrhL
MKPYNLKSISVHYKNSAVHYPGLDGLRGVAVISVIFYHVFQFRPGWMGVDLFFVLSGFLISSILLDTKKSPGYFRNFYVKRVLRIFPLYYLSLTLFFLPFLIHHGRSVATEALPYFAYVQNISFTIKNQWPVDWLSPLNHFWSLAIEEQFYLFFPLLIYAVRDKLLPVVCTILILLTIACRLWFFFGLKNGVGCYVFTFCRIDSLLIGTMAALYARSYTTIRMEYFLLILAAVIFIASVNMDFASPLYSTIGFTCNALFFAFILLFSLSPNNYLSRILGSSVLRHFGKYSYGLYVFHHIYFILINYTVFNYFKEPGIMQKMVPVFTLAATYISALLSFHFFETPFLRLKKRFVSA